MIRHKWNKEAVCTMEKQIVIRSLKTIQIVIVGKQLEMVDISPYLPYIGGHLAFFWYYFFFGINQCIIPCFLTFYSVAVYKSCPTSPILFFILIYCFTPFFPQ